MMKKIPREKVMDKLSQLLHIPYEYFDETGSKLSYAR